MTPTFLCLGAGVQSSAMLLYIYDGVIKKPDYIVFSDTGSEMPYTYEHIENTLKPFCEEKLNMPLIVVRGGKIEDGAFQDYDLHEFYYERNLIPMRGIRSCTDRFKIAPIRRFMRSIVGFTNKGTINKNGSLLKKTHLCSIQLGITTDENHRMHTSDVKWVRNTFPLIENNLSWTDCKERMAQEGWSTEKSGCFICPYQGLKSWRLLRTRYPPLFIKALDMEEALITKRPNRTYGFLREKILLKDFNWKGEKEELFSGCDDFYCFT